MSLLVCGQCGTRYAVGLTACPHCSCTEVADDSVGRIPIAVTVHCPAEPCEVYGKQRRIVLRRAVMGVVELPTLLCEVCGSQVAVRWPGEVRKEQDMPKITVHGGPSNASVPIVTGGSWGDPQDEIAEPVSTTKTVGESGPEVVELPEGAVVSAGGVDQGPGEVAESEGGPFKPLPEVVEGDTSEHVSEPDYDAWSFEDLKAACKARDLSAGGGVQACIARLREADADGEVSTDG